MDHWTQYLYKHHSESQLRDWASRLKMFRYFRAYGGHANDGDSLDVAFRYTSVESLLSIFESIGYVPTVFKKKPDQAVAGIRYTHEEYSSYPSLIEKTEWIQQPGYCEIFGVQVFIWCGNGIVTISASPGNYQVTSEHVEAAEKLEKNLRELAFDVVDPPRDTKHYICPKYHPHLFR